MIDIIQEEHCRQQQNTNTRTLHSTSFTMPVSLSSSSSKTSNVANATYTPIPHPPTPYKSFQSFYPFYLGEHSVRGNRIMHMTGTSAALGAGVYGALCAGAALALRLQSSLEHVIPKLLTPTWGAQEWLKFGIFGIVQGYAWAWLGHVLLERNRPATFKVGSAKTNRIALLTPFPPFSILYGPSWGT
jgi:hypothetical protein